MSKWTHAARHVTRRALDWMFGPPRPRGSESLPAPLGMCPGCEALREMPRAWVLCRSCWAQLPFDFQSRIAFAWDVKRSGSPRLFIGALTDARRFLQDRRNPALTQR